MTLFHLDKPLIGVLDPISDLLTNHEKDIGETVLNVVEGTGTNYLGLFVSLGTKGRKPKDRFMWFPAARPRDLVNKAALLLKLSLDRGFQPGENSDEPTLFSMETTPVHPFLREALIEARNRPAFSKIQECKVGLETLCPVCDERIPKDQQAKLCTERAARGLTAYLVCRNCCRELE